MKRNEKTKKILDITGTELKPGKPLECAGNTQDENCCCDECDHYLKCFPNSENEELQPTVRH